MKSTITMLTVLALLNGSAAAALEATDSRIDAVTVYRDGATITRLATADVAAGLNSVTLEGLPGSIDTSSLQVEVRTQGATLGQLRLETVEQREAFGEEVRRLTGQIEQLRRRIDTLNDDTKSAQLQLKFLDGLAEGYARQAWLEGARGTADVSSWKEALSVLGGGADSAHERMRRGATARAEADKELSRLKRELSHARGDSLASTRLHVTLESDRARTVALRLSYYQSDASWSPAYVARLDSDARQLTLTQTALVNQTSAEPWQDVRLTLSTSEPGRDLARPELTSQFLNLRDPAALRKPAARADLAAEGIIAPSPAPVAPEVTAYAVSYDVPGRVTVDNTADAPQSFDVGAYRFDDVALKTQLVPRVTTDAFLTATLDYAGTVPLDSAPLQLFVDGSYAGQTTLPMALPGATLTLPLGPDRRVTLTVRNQGGEQRSSGIISRKRSDVTDYLFEITNRHSGPATVEVFDRYPVSRNEDINVTVPRSATAPDQTDVEDKPGVVEWHKVLDAGESWRIRHQYEVSYPVERVVVPD